MNKVYKIKKFTIHFATINTKNLISYREKRVTFTIHFATINTEDELGRKRFEMHLQYTLLLLIQTIIVQEATADEIYNTLCYY